MDHLNTIIATFEKHNDADRAVKAIVSTGLNIKNVSVIGKGYHTEEKASGFYNIGDRMAFWGARGAFWGGLWGLFFGGVFLTIPAVGSVIVLGYLAAAVLSALEGAVVVGGLSAIGAALFSIGIPNDSVIRYEMAVKADSFLVMANGTSDEVTKIGKIMRDMGATHVDVYDSETVPQEA